MERWTISSRTFALPVGGGAVHSYIAIKDNSGRVVAEYHGFPYNRETGDRENDNPLAFTPLSDFQLLAEQHPGEFWPSRQDLRVHDEEIFRGSRSQVEQIQAEMNRAVKDINRLDLDYGGVHFLSESQNSNSVYRTLMDVAGDKAEEIGAAIVVPGRLLQDDIVFDSQSRSSWAPGIHNNLLPNGTSASPKKQPPPLFKNRS